MAVNPGSPQLSGKSTSLRRPSMSGGSFSADNGLNPLRNSYNASDNIAARASEAAARFRETTGLAKSSERRRSMDRGEGEEGGAPLRRSLDGGGLGGSLQRRQESFSYGKDSPYEDTLGLNPLRKTVYNQADEIAARAAEAAAAFREKAGLAKPNEKRRSIDNEGPPNLQRRSMDAGLVRGGNVGRKDRRPSNGGDFGGPPDLNSFSNANSNDSGYNNGATNGNFPGPNNSQSGGSYNNNPSLNRSLSGNNLSSAAGSYANNYSNGNNNSGGNWGRPDSFAGFNSPTSKSQSANGRSQTRKGPLAFLKRLLPDTSRARQRGQSRSLDRRSAGRVTWNDQDSGVNPAKNTAYRPNSNLYNGSNTGNGYGSGTNNTTGSYGGNGEGSLSYDSRSYGNVDLYERASNLRSGNGYSSRYYNQYDDYDSSDTGMVRGQSITLLREATQKRIPPKLNSYPLADMASYVTPGSSPFQSTTGWNSSTDVYGQPLQVRTNSATEYGNGWNSSSNSSSPIYSNGPSPTSVLRSNSTAYGGAAPPSTPYYANNNNNNSPEMGKLVRMSSQVQQSLDLSDPVSGAFVLKSLMNTDAPAGGAGANGNASFADGGNFNGSAIRTTDKLLLV
ncbi:hypothetical protein WJX72_006626 [[Myrmecia] bisecta]|uniref:Uncharacterized protein n=1 Tax=[Myrmecia] bisecta TaxID=41462 RepID=A0AAW1PI09_9CHLO